MVLLSAIIQSYFDEPAGDGGSGVCLRGPLEDIKEILANREILCLTVTERATIVSDDFG